jgi:hypothetical protein
VVVLFFVVFAFLEVMFGLFVVIFALGLATGDCPGLSASA